MKRWMAALLLVSVGASAQETTASKKAEDDVMAYYIESAKPVAEHARLAELSGAWKVTMKLWFDPDSDAQISSGTGTGRMILGGRFLEMRSDIRGAFPAESLNIFGFDRRTNDYTMVGYDTLGTYWISAAGKLDAAQKAVVLHGTYAQPPALQQQAYRFVWTKPAENEHLLTLYFAMDGKDVRVAETRFTR